MSALVTVPFEIDPVNFSRQGGTEINPMGPFLFGGKQYWVGCYNSNGTAGVRKLAIFGSTTDWASATELDTAHAPGTLAALGLNPAATLNVYFDPAGIIGVLYTLADNSSHIIEFACGADTYGSAGAGLAGGVLNTKNLFFKRTDGTYVVINELTGNFVRYTYASGAWVGPTTIVGTAYIPSAQIYDQATGICHLVFQNPVGSEMLYAQLDASYTLSSPITLPTSPDTEPDDFRASVAFFGAGIAIGWTSYLADLGQAWAAIAPDRSSPVFTGYNLFTGNNDGSDGASYMTVGIDGSGVLSAFFVETDYNSDPIVDRLWWRVFNGSSFNAPVLVYDAVANPPSDGNPDETAQNIHTGDVLFNGTMWIIPFALETVNSAQDHCTGFMIVFPGTPPVTLTFNLKGSQPSGQPAGTLLSVNPSGSAPGPVINPIQCILQSDYTPGGTTPIGPNPPSPPAPPPAPPIAVPVITSLSIPGGTEDFYYSFQVIATGSPTAWTATGLPAGMFISPKFGTIVGTPTVSGSFSVVVSCSNSGGSSLPVTFPLTIGGMGVVPTITSTSPLPQGNVGTPYSFQFTATGTSPISWAGLVPGGTSIQMTVGGLLTWTNPVAGSYTVQIQAYNGAGATAYIPFVLVISDVPLPPTPPTPPGG